MPTIKPVPKVIDMSHHQEYPQFGILKQHGIEAVIFKATEGTSYVDPTIDERLPRAFSVGMKIGVYHFMTSEDPEAQYRHFRSVVDPFRKHCGGAVMSFDFEERKAGMEATPETLDEMVKVMVADLYRHPWLYGSAKLIQALSRKNCPKWVKECALWLARYKSKEPPVLPCLLWQYDELGMIGDQGPYDLNHVMGGYDVAKLFDRWKI